MYSAHHGAELQQRRHKAFVEGGVWVCGYERELVEEVRHDEGDGDDALVVAEEEAAHCGEEGAAQDEGVAGEVVEGGHGGGGRDGG